jgi:hypothetical protein
MVVVEIKNLPKTWDSLDDKYDFLEDLYIELLNLADRLDADRIQFVGEAQTLH